LILNQKIFKENNKTFNFIYIDTYIYFEYEIKDNIEKSFNILEKNGILWINHYNYSLNITEIMDDFLIINKGKYKIISLDYELAIQKNIN